ncbi:MAG: glyoxalase/bleomycin resistance/extradiol dioxygenase family protein [Ferruginibacter sp.]
MKLTPYIHYSGNAEEALNFYAAALNGTVQQINRYGDSPMESGEDWKQKIVHARLVFDDNMIMISDSFKGNPVSTGGNVQLNIDVEDAGKLETVFNRMAEGGTVIMALQDTFWGARFGMLKDKFGVSWMFNCEIKK